MNPNYHQLVHATLTLIILIGLLLSCHFRVIGDGQHQQQQQQVAPPPQSNSNQQIQYAPVVRVQGGLVRGIVQQTLGLGPPVHLYQGIRYGQAERFRRAELVPPWEGVYDAIEPRENCPMTTQPAEDGYLTNRTSEDCLYLNVWCPSNSHPMNPILRPVMVYIYGGSFLTGSIFKANHDGRYLAAKGDLLVVTMNFRKGAFGFLFRGDLNQTNLGLHDQLLALAWVRDNIRAFGGDPNLITLFGNSAGSVSVATLLLSPLLPPVRRAIIQSAVPVRFDDVQTLDEAREATRNLAIYLNCTKDSEKEMIQCLRAVPTREFITKGKAVLKLRPLFGDHLLPERPNPSRVNPFSASSNAKFDLMFGVVRDEGPSFVGGRFPEYFSPEANLTETDLPAGFRAMAKMCYGNNRAPPPKDSWLEEVVDFYIAQVPNLLQGQSEGFSRQEKLKNLIGTVYGDCRFTCPVVLFGEEMAKRRMEARRIHHSNSAGAPEYNNQYYAYRLMVPAGGRARARKECSEPWMGVCHGDELFHLFNVPEQLTVDERQLGLDLIGAWTSFAWTGNPGPTIGAEKVRWEQAFRVMKNSSDSFPVTQLMALDPRNYTMVRGLFEQRCNRFWGPWLMLT